VGRRWVAGTNPFYEILMKISCDAVAYPVLYSTAGLATCFFLLLHVTPYSSCIGPAFPLPFVHTHADVIVKPSAACSAMCSRSKKPLALGNLIVFLPRDKIRQAWVFQCCGSCTFLQIHGTSSTGWTPFSHRHWPIW
jgi:hypothetical protein